MQESGRMDTLTRFTAAMLISGYQKYLSPHKGFSCAHRVWHRGESCSQYTKRTIVERGLLVALPLVRERFRECKLSNERLRRRRQALLNTCRHSRVRSLSDSLARIDSIEEDLESADKQEQGQRKPSDSAGSSSSNSCNGHELDCCEGCGNVGTCDRHALHCPSIDCAGLDCTGLDCSAIDCAGLDCTGLDCSAIDCTDLDCSGCDGCSGSDCSGCSW
jgi:putative component of membrane protein insertase Oxa1/YidC/SpoIIIJ protein YidD